MVLKKEYKGVRTGTKVGATYGNIYHYNEPAQIVLSENNVNNLYKQPDRTFSLNKKKRWEAVANPVHGAPDVPEIAFSEGHCSKRVITPAAQASQSKAQGGKKKDKKKNKKNTGESESDSGAEIADVVKVERRPRHKKGRSDCRCDQCVADLEALSPLKTREQYLTEKQVEKTTALLHSFGKYADTSAISQIVVEIPPTARGKAGRQAGTIDPISGYSALEIDCGALGVTGYVHSERYCGGAWNRRKEMSQRVSGKAYCHTRDIVVC
eukprot:GFYU01001188.1.p1 GENE.GFYU01001188.1~~GFYU01001188.1.p1  ORF type:complete len:267 (+),score=56.82 GFYU01001188.1:130-930(+)